jgi:hypothetical protein
MSDNQQPPLRWSEEQLKRRRQRNLALAWVLGGVVLLFFVITIAKLGGNVADRPVYGSMELIKHIG